MEGLAAIGGILAALKLLMSILLVLNKNWFIQELKDNESKRNIEDGTKPPQVTEIYSIESFDKMRLEIIELRKEIQELKSIVKKEQ